MNSAIFKALMFVLEYVINHGDSDMSVKAKRHKQMIEEELAPMTAIQESLPHEGSQSPQSKTSDGLGGTDENHQD